MAELSRVLYTTNGITPARYSAIQDTSSSYLQDTSQTLAYVQARKTSYPALQQLQHHAQQARGVVQLVRTHLDCSVVSGRMYTTIHCRLNLAAINRLSRPTSSEPHQMPSRHLICNQRCRLYHLLCSHCAAILYYCYTQVDFMTRFLSPADHCIMHRGISRTPQHRSPSIGHQKTP